MRRNLYDEAITLNNESIRIDLHATDAAGIFLAFVHVGERAEGHAIRLLIISFSKGL